MEDEWLTAALNDDRIVAELLLRLKQSDSHPSRPSKPPLPLPPQNWGARLPRSRSSTKEREPTRRSPTTPLSWSAGAASPSDGYEESSSRPSDRSATVRSKGTGANETNNTATASTSKKPKRKKTFAELKEEESVLLKERSHLKREIASLNVTVKEQRSLNQNLKRMKTDYRTKSGAALIEVAEKKKKMIDARPTQVSASSSIPRPVDASEPSSRPVVELTGCTLPDLNMLPDDYSTDALVAAS